MKTIPLQRRASPLFIAARLMPFIIGALAITLFPLLLLCSGCASMERALYEPSTVIVPGQTNITVTAQQTTNATGEVETTLATNTVVIPEHARPSIETKPVVTGYIEAIKAAPLPFAGTLGVILGGLYAGYAQARRSKSVAVALVKGIETGREWLQETPEGRAHDAKLLRYLKENQEYAGVLNEVAALVNEHTGNTVK